MIRNVFTAKRGKAPEVVGIFKTVNGMFVSMGDTTGKIHVDFTGPFDKVAFSFETDSTDQFFTMERGLFTDPGTSPLMARLNESTLSGYREIYEVIV
jgi:hypothetical protein